MTENALEVPASMMFTSEPHHTSLFLLWKSNFLWKNSFCKKRCYIIEQKSIIKKSLLQKEKKNMAQKRFDVKIQVSLKNCCIFGMGFPRSHVRSEVAEYICKSILYSKLAGRDGSVPRSLWTSREQLGLLQV